MLLGALVDHVLRHLGETSLRSQRLGSVSSQRLGGLSLENIPAAFYKRGWDLRLIDATWFCNEVCLQKHLGKPGAELTPAPH